MPALHLDAALVHMNLADAQGNSAFLGPDPYFDDLFCMAAERRFVSCERIVSAAELATSPLQSLRVQRWMVDGVVEAPRGAHFTECRANNPVSAIACKACGAVMPGISEVFTMDSLSGNEPSHAEPRQQEHRPGVAVEEHYSRGGQGPSLLGRVKLVVEQGKILGEQFLLSDFEMMVGRYDAGSGRCPDIDLTAQDPAYVHRQHVHGRRRAAGG